MQEIEKMQIRPLYLTKAYRVYIGELMNVIYFYHNNLTNHTLRDDPLWTVINVSSVVKYTRRSEL